MYSGGDATKKRSIGVCMPPFMLHCRLDSLKMRE